jgi:hypothetical protein
LVYRKARRVKVQAVRFGSRIKRGRRSCSYPPEINEWENGWEYDQMNDAAIQAADLDIEKVSEALALLTPDPERASELLTDLAQEGSVRSMVNLGACYLHGLGTPVSLPDAEHWYRRAYEAGSDRGLLGYAWFLQHRGAFDEELAVYAAGVKRGWPPAIGRYAYRMLRRARTVHERVEVLPLLGQAADLGSPTVQLVLCQFMLRGRFGLRYLPEGVRRSFRYFRAALVGWKVGSARLKRRAAAISSAGATLH